MNVKLISEKREPVLKHKLCDKTECKITECGKSTQEFLEYFRIVSKYCIWICENCEVCMKE